MAKVRQTVQLGEIMMDLRCGDALELLTHLESESVDLIIADPPYNLGKNYGNNTDHKAFDEYLEFSKSWLSEAARVLKPTGTIYVFMGVRFISHIYNILEQDLGLHFNSWIVWHYTQGMGRTRGFSPRHDDILMFSKSEQFTFNLDAVRVPQKYYRERNNMRGANPGDVWEFSHVHYCNENRQDHPTQKPEGLLERMILASSHAGELVLDPFFGSGTTPRVCQQLERRFFGFELNPEYVAMTKRRLEKPFDSFDSIDPRMERIPNDLRDPVLRRNYMTNHIAWFLQNHQGSLELFKKQLRENTAMNLRLCLKRHFLMLDSRKQKICYTVCIPQSSSKRRFSRGEFEEVMLTIPAPNRPQGKYRMSFAEFNQLLEMDFFGEESVELLDGEVFIKGKQNPPHQQAVRHLTKLLERNLGDKIVVSSQLPLVLESPPPDYLEPDIALV